MSSNADNEAGPAAAKAPLSRDEKYAKTLTASKIMQYVSITMLVMMCVMRIIAFVTVPSVVSMVLTVYYLLFAIILLFVELGLKGARYQFFFLNFAWGKGSAAIFIAFTMVGGDVQSWLQIPIGIFFFATGILYLALSCMFKDYEAKRV